MWNELDWKIIDAHVLKIQIKIYNASINGLTQEVHKYQGLLINSYHAKCKAVRTVTQDNSGKNTPGVDGVKSLNPQEPMKLTKTLKVDGQCSIIRRVYIPKEGSPRGRPLGIPTMKDRAKQALVKLALEPEWEAKFEPNSYGFRPGRATHDAIEAIYKSICRKPKYVLDSDIVKCFDRISHDALIEKLNTTDCIKKQIRAWLKAGILEPGAEQRETPENLRGTPQGGVISPLLSNIALHGIETAAKSKIKEAHGVRVSKSLTVIRYADDICALHPDENILHKVKDIIGECLAEVGV